MHIVTRPQLPVLDLSQLSGTAAEQALFDSILVFENFPVAEALKQGAPAAQRTREAYGLNRRMLDQRLTDATAVDHVEHAGRHAGFLRGADDGIRDPLGRCHVAAVGLEHHRAPCRESRCGIAARR